MKTSIIGDVKKQHELFRKLIVSGECRFAETGNSRERSLRSAKHPSVRHRGVVADQELEWRDNLTS